MPTHINQQNTSYSVCLGSSTSIVYPQTYQPTLTYIYMIYLDKYVALMFRWGQLFQPCPAAGTFEMAAKPLGTSANFKPADGDK